MNKCKNCGHRKELHKTDCHWSQVTGGGDSVKLRSVEFCHCENFVEENQVAVDRFGIPKKDWWCVLDYFENEILYRKGFGGSAKGEDFYKRVKDNETARQLWEKYKDFQVGEFSL